jgi:hypothetical protein
VLIFSEVVFKVPRSIITPGSDDGVEALELLSEYDPVGKAWLDADEFIHEVMNQYGIL